MTAGELCADAAAPAAGESVGRRSIEEQDQVRTVEGADVRPIRIRAETEHRPGSSGRIVRRGDEQHAWPIRVAGANVAGGGRTHTVQRDRRMPDATVEGEGAGRGSVRAST